MKHIAIVSVITMSTIAGGSDRVDIDPENPVIAVQQQIRENAEIYEKLTGNKPTNENLRATLENPPDGPKTAALDILISSGTASRWAMPAVQKCYDASGGNWLIKVKCVQTMLSVDSDTGVRAARQLIGDPQMCLEAKLLVSRALTEVNRPDGYGVLREGLASQKPYDRTLAVDLFRAFVPLNGAVVPETTDRVDLRGLAKEFESRVPKLAEILSSQMGDTAPPRTPRFPAFSNATLQCPPSRFWHASFAPDRATYTWRPALPFWL